MRTLSAIVLSLMVATAASASAFFLDREGILWKGTSTSEGLVLTGERDGETLVSTVVPFELGISGTTDTSIQVAADEITGKVTVVWQRNWSEDVSEILMATWMDGDWDRIEHLTPSLSANPRNPMVYLSQVSSTVPDPDDPENFISITESFLHVTWWEGTSEWQSARYAFLNLTADPGEESLSVLDLDEFLPIRVGCSPASKELIEFPRFAESIGETSVSVLFGSNQTCSFHLFRIDFIPPGDDPEPDPGVSADRRRHAIIFGVRDSLEVPPAIRMTGSQVLLGRTGLPVIYTLHGDTLEYAVAGASGTWSPLRHVPIGDELTSLDAVALVQRLAR